MASRVVEAFECDPDFCPDCGSILPLPGIEDIVSCKICDFQKSTSEFEGIEVHSRKVFNEIKERKSKVDDAQDSIGPMVDRKCSSCGHEGMTYQTRQTRSVDEGQTVFYNCPNCRNQETEYS